MIENKIDPKVEYLSRTLSRTKRKDYENYVINAIYQRLGNLNIKPITQQYIKRESGKAFIDLYFPQINQGVEVQELFHKNQVNEDENREEAIKEADKLREHENNRLILNQLNKTSVKYGEYIQYNIDMSLHLEELEEEINKVVNNIKEAYIKAGSPIWEIKNPVKAAREKGFLDIKDDLVFEKVSDIKPLFGIPIQLNKNGKVHNATCTFKVKSYLEGGEEKDLVWCPHIQTDALSSEIGWENTISDDLSKIIQQKSGERVPKNKNEENYYRYVFAKLKNEFGVVVHRFIGVYKLTEITEDGREIMERVSTRLYLNDYPVLNENEIYLESNIK